jgi:hypothetical protein
MMYVYICNQIDTQIQNIMMNIENLKVFVSSLC